MINEKYTMIKYSQGLVSLLKELKLYKVSLEFKSTKLVQRLETIVPKDKLMEGKSLNQLSFESELNSQK